MHGRLKPSATFHKLGFVAINPAVSRCFGDSFEIPPWNRVREVGKSDKDDGRIPQPTVQSSTPCFVLTRVVEGRDVFLAETTSPKARFRTYPSLRLL